MSSESNAPAVTPLEVLTPSDREIRIERIFNAPRERVWRAFTEPALAAQWWGRGNRLEIEQMDARTGGRWRFIEHAPGEDPQGFSGAYREVTPQERIVQTFEWDGMPGYVALETAEFEDLGEGRTKVTSTSLFFTPEERDGMLQSGMEFGMAESYAALDRLLESMAA